MTQFFRNNRGISTKPDRGVFPIDHHGQCDSYLEIYMDCLSSMNGWASMCKQSMKNYLKCRVHKNLMTQSDFDATGYVMDDTLVEEAYYLTEIGSIHHDKERTGFVAGLGPRASQNRFEKVIVRPEMHLQVPSSTNGEKVYLDPPLNCDPPPTPEGY